MQVKDFFKEDRMAVGLVAGLGTETVALLILGVVCSLLHYPLVANLRWLGVCFVPLVLLLHYYAVRQRLLQVVRSLIVILFVTFIIFMLLLSRTGQLL